MVQVTLEHAEHHLADLIAQVQAGEEILITRGDEVLARLSHNDEIQNIGQRKAGLMRGSVLYIADDFDAPLEDFKDYM